MSQLITPERYKRYYATVRYHRTDNLRQPTADDPTPVPPDGSLVTVRTAWLMDEDDPFPGELAFLVEKPVGYHHWLPQRDLTDFEPCSEIGIKRVAGPATLYLNGQAIGTVNVSLPEPAPLEPILLSATVAADFILRYPPGKKGRHQRQQFCNLLWDNGTLALARHYQRVKHHQLRKRLINKRK